MNKEKVGFSPEKEEKFLSRLPNKIRRVNLDKELETQLAEDFGLVEFTLKYRFNEEGKIVDLNSGQKLVELTSRGEVKEEIESIKKIENGLKDNPEKIWIHFSPKNKNEKFEYPNNCVDFWRVEDGEIIWNRMVIKNNFEEMNEIREFISGEKKVKDEMEILKSPIAVDLKLTEIFSLFQLKEIQNFSDFGDIERVVEKYIDEFSNDFGEKLTKDGDLIFRLYSACFDALRDRKIGNEVMIDRIDLENYMYGIMSEVRVEKSFGCAATTTVGSFGEKIGYYILPGGEVKYGKIPDDYRECKKCGCWYKGEKCPFC
jgi:hypothetical protein